jgi:hypothetical protein
VLSRVILQHSQRNSIPMRRLSFAARIGRLSKIAGSRETLEVMVAMFDLRNSAPVCERSELVV